ncbi:chaplin [Streptomyces sp. NPDC001985]|uniref:chaplin n=1 Tax=Streptomyces sp. NPDC001985 TaxID=3154406 RepID=UPI00333498FB
MSRFAKAAAVVAGSGALLVGGAGMATADAGAHGAATHSPGVLSGNLVQVPVHIPVNVCGNTVNIIALLNPTFGNTCVNASEGSAYGH